MDVFIVDAVRTPFGKRSGALSKTHPVGLAAVVLNELQARNNFDPIQLGMVQFGCSTPIGEQSLNISRNAVLAAGWSESIPAVTLDSLSVSGHLSIHFAVAMVKSAMAQACIAGGVDSPSRIPPGAVNGPGIGKPFGPLVNERYALDGGLLPAGLVAERFANNHGITRKQLDAYAGESRKRLASAWARGVFKNQLVGDFGLGHDELMDEQMNLSTFKPAFDVQGIITAGTFPQPADGACGLLIASEAWCEQTGLDPLARVVQCRSFGLDVLNGGLPMGLAELADFDRIDVQEDSAVTPLAVAKTMGIKPSEVNPQGGSLATGDALSASSASIVANSAHAIKDEALTTTLAISAGTTCVGVVTVLGKP